MKLSVLIFQIFKKIKQFNKNGTNASTRWYLNRSYPRAICGYGTYFDFNTTANSFVLIYDMRLPNKFYFYLHIHLFF